MSRHRYKDYTKNYNKDLSPEIEPKSSKEEVEEILKDKVEDEPTTMEDSEPVEEAEIADSVDDPTDELIAAAEAVDEAKGKTGVVNCEKLRVRMSPSTEARVINHITEGTEVEVIAGSDEWLNVKITKGGYAYSGFVMKKFITM